MVTAYAPDTVIDYLLLRHEPRFAYYSRFFHAMAEVSEDLMSVRTIPDSKPLPTSGGGSENKTATVSLGHCTDDDPAHMGKLDSSQKWKAGGGGSVSSTPFTLQNEGTGLCLDPLGGTKPPALKACSSTPQMQWTYASQQFASVATRPCQTPGSEGERCHVCLGVSGAQGVDLWDCKPDGSPHGGNDNQKFSYSPTKQGIVAASSKACLTAAAADGGGAEVTVYGGVAFLSNMDDADDVTVTFEGE